MTYPYPQQPQDPYNQGGYPQQGYPQQGGWQQGGYPQQGGGFPPPPPPKSNTTLIVSIVAVVVLALGALGVTGFVAPGFFLSGDKDDGGGGGSGGSGGGNTPQALAQSIVDAFNKKDQAALNALKCADAAEDVDQVIAQAPSVENATLGAVQKKDDANARFEVWSAQVTVVVSGSPMQAEGLMGNPNGKWCWGDVDLGGSIPGGPSSAPSAPAGIPSVPPVDPSAPSGGGGSSDLNTLMQDFLSSINSGDVSGAQAKMCTDGTPSSAQEAINKDVNLKLDSPPETTGTFVIGDVSGTNGDGARTIGSIDAEREDESSPWCIEELRLY